MHSSMLPTIVERSENGPFMKESDFDMALAMKTSELANKYNLVFDRQIVVPSDEDLADRVYQAGLDLFVEMGAYNQSTERRILFSREEVEVAVAAAPNAVSLGTGKDAVVMRHLEIESGQPNVVHSGPTGTPCSERYHPFIQLSCAMEPLVDCIGAGSVSTYMGQRIVPSSPTEILAARRDAASAREILRQVGRPGMHINDIPVPLTCAGKMATIDQTYGLRPTDGLLVTQLPELKTNYDQLSRVAFMQAYDMVIVDLMTPLIGGLGGGVEGTAVVNIASHILAAVLYDVDYHDMGHMSLRYSHNTGRMGLWIYAVAGQALARNTPMVTSNAIYTRNGLGTCEVLWEVAAGAMSSAMCGVHQMGVGATGGAREDHTSGLEARFNAEVAHAAIRLTREEANDYVLRFLEKYEGTIDEPQPGSPFLEIYDVDRLEPTETWLACYHEVRNEIIEMGLDLDQGWRAVRHGS
jgi:methylamine--corrinoid protein Co-methyltransferase